MSDQGQGYGASGKNSPDRIAPQPQAAACHPGDCGREVDSSIGPPMVEPVQFSLQKEGSPAQYGDVLSEGRP
jgi:hypothetical protein